MKKAINKKVTKYQPKLTRIFSDTFKRRRVEEIENGIVTIHQVSQAYNVSDNAVRKWIRKYSRMIHSGVRQVVELESEAARTIALQKRTEELERIIGQKQLQLDYYEQLISVASKELDVDIKKNFDTMFSIGSSAPQKKGLGE